MLKLFRRLFATKAIYVVDYSFSRPPAASVKAAGASGAIRYLSSDAKKCITVAEAKALHSAGIPFALVYEDAQDDFAGGANAGAAKAAIAAKTVKALIKAGLWSADRPIYCAVDENAPQSTYLDTWEGIQAFAKSVGCSEGAYGPRPFLNYLETKHGVVWLFELGSSSFNTGQEPPANKRIQQEVVVPKGCKPLAGVDWDTVLMSDWGQFPAPVTPKPPMPAPAPKPVPQPTPKPSPLEDNEDMRVDTPVKVTIKKGAHQGTATTSVVFADVKGVWLEAGAGPNIVSEWAVANNGGNAEVIAKMITAPTANLTVTVHLDVAA